MIDTQTRIQMSQALNLAHQDFKRQDKEQNKQHIMARATFYFDMLNELYQSLEPKPILMPKIELKPIQRHIIEVEEIDIVDDYEREERDYEEGDDEE